MAAEVCHLHELTADSVRRYLIGKGVAAGLPAFCEKPVATDLDATRAVRDLVEDAGAIVQIGFQRRFDAGYRRAAEAVRSGELGWIHSIRANTNATCMMIGERVADLVVSGA